MKKLMLLLLTCFTMLSCGDDDSNSNSGPKPASISIGNNGEPLIYNLTYDSKNRIQTVNNGTINATLSYTAKNQVDRITTGTSFAQFSYNDEGRLLSIVTDEGQDLNVSATGDNIYDFAGTTAILNDNGDYISLGTLNFTYSSAKGAFANVKHVDVIALQFVIQSSYFFAGKKRLEMLSSGGTTYPIVSTAGEKGLPATYLIDGSLVTFTYN